MKRLIWVFFSLLFIAAVAEAEVIKLKSGQVIKAKILEKESDSIQVDVVGLPVTYFKDEIETIDGATIFGNAETAPKQAAEPVSLPESPSQEEGIKSYTAAKQNYSELTGSYQQLEGDLKVLAGPLSEAAKNYLLTNKQALDQFKQATLAKTGGYILAGGKPGELNAESAPRYITYAGLFRVLLLELKQYLDEGNLAKTQEDIDFSMRFLHHASREQYGIFAMVMQGIYWDQWEPVVTAIIQRRDFSRDFYQQLLQKLTALNEGRYSIVDSFKFEQEISLAGLKIAKNLFTPPEWKYSAEELAKKFTDASPEALSERTFKNVAFYYFLVVRVNNLIAADALKLFYIDHKKFPQDLAELVPDYLSAVPADPFNGFKPIKYRVTENDARVYSLGTDRMDQQGETAARSIVDLKAEDYPPPGDIVFILKM